MLREILIFSLLIVVGVHSIQCYKDKLEGKGNKHTTDKSVKNCTCNYCLKGTGKVNDNDYTIWGCGCDNGFIDCKEKGKDHVKLKRDENDKEHNVNFWCCDSEWCNSTQDHRRFTIFVPFFIIYVLRF